MIVVDLYIQFFFGIFSKHYYFLSAMSVLSPLVGANSLDIHENISHNLSPVKNSARQHYMKKKYLSGLSAASKRISDENTTDSAKNSFDVSIVCKTPNKGHTKRNDLTKKSSKDLLNDMSLYNSNLGDADDIDLLSATPVSVKPNRAPERSCNMEHSNSESSSAFDIDITNNVSVTPSSSSSSAKSKRKGLSLSMPVEADIGHNSSESSAIGHIIIQEVAASPRATKIASELQKMRRMKSPRSSKKNGCLSPRAKLIDSTKKTIDSVMKMINDNASLCSSPTSPSSEQGIEVLISSLNFQGGSPKSPYVKPIGQSQRQ